MKKNILRIISIIALSILVPQCASADVLYGNFARTIFTNAVTTTNTTSFKVLAVTNFPTISSTNDYYYLVCLKASDNKKEIVKVTAASGGTLTVIRGQENTVPQTFAVNDKLELWITAGTLGAIQQEMFTYTDDEILKQLTVNTSNLADYVVTTIKLATNAVQTYSISNGVVTSDKILDYTISAVDIASNNVLTQHILNTNVTTAKIADDNVTFAKMQEISTYTVLGNIGAITTNPVEVKIFDQDDMVSNSATALCSQQSIKAYSDSIRPTYYGISTNVYFGDTSWGDFNATERCNLSAGRYAVYLQGHYGGLLATNATIYFRTNGDTNDITVAANTVATSFGASVGYVATNCSFYAYVLSDTNGVLEIKSSNGSGVTVVCKILTMQKIN
jgi:hypothetical protein